MKKDFPFNKLEKITIVFAALSILSFLISIYIFYNHTTAINSSAKLDSNIWGNLGSFLSGVVGSLFSIATVLLLYMAYKAQKIELEETRKILTEQNHALEREQFENTFFKLLTNHADLLKASVDSSPKITLDSMASRLKSFAWYYNFAIKTRMIPGFQMFNYIPQHEPIFKDELVERIITDINHISDFISSKKKSLNSEEIPFYFTSLFNSLYNCEKYLFGYYIDLALGKLNNEKSSHLNLVYNEYYNALPDENKVKHSNAKDFYPAIDVYLTPYPEMHMDLMKLNSNHPVLVIENNNDDNASITIKDIKLNTYSNLDVIFSERLEGFKETKLDQTYRLSIDLYEYFNKNYFKGELTNLLTSPTNDKISIVDKHLENFRKQEDRTKNYLIIEISVIDSIGNQFQYYGEIFFVLPAFHGQNFELKLENAFDNNLLVKLKRVKSFNRVNEIEVKI